MARRWLVAMGLAIFSWAAVAGGPGAVRKQIEASRLVTGVIEVEADGSVSRLDLDKVAELPTGVVEFVDSRVREWTFAPVLVDGKPVAIRNKMSVLVVAKKLDDGQYSIRLQAVSFDPFKVEEGAELSSEQMTPPRYPSAAALSGVAGTVFVVLKIGRDGRVEESFAEQVNLGFVDTENQMNYWRGILANSALAASRDWRFITPVIGEAATEPFWTARVPVDYVLENTTDKNGWRAYVPGPRQSTPWAAPAEAGYSPEALAGGGLYQAGREGLRLLTPLGGDG